MDYQLAENEIQEYLQDKLGDDIQVVVLPDTVQEYNKTIAKPRVTVSYFKSEFDMPAGTFGYQAERVMFRLIIQSKLRKSAGGIFDVLAKLKTAIQGFRISELGELFIEKIDLEEYDPDAKVWSYVLQISAKAILVKDIPEEDASIIQHITIQSPYGSTDIT